MVRLLAPIPPLAEQRKIVAILSSANDAIEKTHAIIYQVQVVKRGLMQELLSPRSVRTTHAIQANRDRGKYRTHGRWYRSLNAKLR